MQKTGAKNQKISEIVDTLTKEYDPKKIILFGSKARGDSDEYSDLDLIIIKDTKKRIIERLLEVPMLPINSDIFVYTPEEIEKMKENENPFITKALSEGKVIYSKR